MSCGLNQHSTPHPPSATPADIDRSLKRQPFNGGDWPKDSPIARVYDIGNTSTSLVLLNKRRMKKSQLRGLTDRSGEILTPDPDRHTQEVPTISWLHHQQCLNYQPELYKPLKTTLDLKWVNSVQRPPVQFDEVTHVNPRRHTSCGDHRRWEPPPRRPHTSASHAVDSELHSISPILNDPDLTPGERRYLYSIARIYSTAQMKLLKQNQYSELLYMELKKGYHSPREFDRYFRYLNTPRRTQIGRLDNYEELKRSASAPPPRSWSQTPSERGSSRQQRRSPGHSSAPSMTSSSRHSSFSRHFRHNSSAGKRKGTRNKHRSQSPSQKPASSKAQQQQGPTSVSATESTADNKEYSGKKEEDQRQSSVEKTSKRSITSKSSASSSRKTNKSPNREHSHHDGENSVKKDNVPGPRKGTGSPKNDDESDSSSSSNGMPPSRKGTESPKKSSSSEMQSDRSNLPMKGELRPTSTSSSHATHTGNSDNKDNSKLLALIINGTENGKDSGKDSSGHSDQPGKDSSGHGDHSRSGTDNSSTTSKTSEDSNTPRDFSDTNLASGYMPRQHKEGQDRPFSRAGRETESTKSEQETSDRDSGTDSDRNSDTTSDKNSDTDSDDEAENPVHEEPTQRSPDKDATSTNSSRIDDSKMEKRGDAGVVTVGPDKQAASPDNSRGQMEQAEDSHNAEGQTRSQAVPVTSRVKSDKEEKDLSEEDRNEDIDRLEY